MEISLFVDVMFSLDTDSDLIEFTEIVPRLSLPLLMKINDDVKVQNCNHVLV